MKAATHANEYNSQDIVIIDDNFVARYVVQQLLAYYASRNSIPTRIFSSGDWLKGIGYLLVKLPGKLILSSTIPQYSSKEVLEFITSNPRLNDHRCRKFILSETNEQLPDEYIVLSRGSNHYLTTLIEEVFDIKIEKKTFWLSLGEFAIKSNSRAKQRPHIASWYHTFVSHLALLILTVTPGRPISGVRQDDLTGYRIFNKEIGKILTPMLGAMLILIMQVTLFTASALYVFRNSSELSRASGQSYTVVFDTFTNSSETPSVGIDFSDSAQIKLKFNPNQHTNGIILNGGEFSSTLFDGDLAEPGIRLEKNYYNKYDSSTSGFPVGIIEQVHQLQDGDFLGLTRDAGFFHFDNQGTPEPGDDQFTLLYSPSTAIPVLTNLNSFYIDEETGLLYLTGTAPFSRCTIYVIDTKKTYNDPSDDTLEGSHAWASPDTFLEKLHGIVKTSYDSGSGILSVLGTFGLVMIDTAKTADTSDDQYLGVWGNEDIPAIAADSTSANEFYRRGRYAFLISAYKNINVIDTQNTATVADDVVVYTYTRASLGFPGTEMLYDLEHDYINDLLYVSGSGSGGGVTVIDLKGTEDYSDDSVMYTHNGSNLGITDEMVGVFPSSYFMQTLYHEKSGNLIVRNYYYVAVIDRHDLSTPDDDELLKFFPTQFLAQDFDVQILSEYTFNVFADDNTGFLYISTSNTSLLEQSWWAVTFDPYVRKGTFTSSQENVEQEVDPNLDHFLVLDSDIPTGSQVILSTRTGKAEITLDEFDDGDTSNVTDYYEWGRPFESVVESGGKLLLSEVSGNWAAHWVTLPSEETFPAGSTIIMKYRVNTSASNFRLSLFTDEWSSVNIDSSDINQEVVLSLTETSDFSQIGIYIEFSNGTWQSEDYLEIESIKVVGTPTWQPWSECSASSSCLINYADSDENLLQFSTLLRSTTGNITPVIKSATLVSGYANSGTFYSGVYDSGGVSDWQQLDANYLTPSNTSVTYSTRTGNSPTIDSSWSDWEVVNGEIKSDDSQYIQYRADLSSSSPALTPAVLSVSMSYEPIQAGPGGNQTDRNIDDRTADDPSPDGDSGSEEDGSSDDDEEDVDAGHSPNETQDDDPIEPGEPINKQSWGERVKGFISKNSEEISTAATVISAMSGAAIILINATLLNITIFEIPYLLISGLNNILTAIGLKKRRNPIGYVYDTVSKSYIANTIVRVFTQSGRLVETTVTDAFGVINTRLVSGVYRLEVRNRRYLSPSQLVTNSEDYPITNVYQGGAAAIEETGEMNMAIPMDPKNTTFISRSVSKLTSRFRNGFFFLNIYVFVFAIWLTLIAYALHPSVITVTVLALQVPTLLFLIYSARSKADRYGIVKDSQGNAVFNVAIALRNITTGTIVSKRVSDSFGRFTFTIPAGKYLIEVMGTDYMLSDNSKAVIEVKGDGLHKVGFDISVTKVNS